MSAFQQVDFEQAQAQHKPGLRTPSGFIKAIKLHTDLQTDQSPQLDPCCSRHEVPYRAQVDQDQNKRFWSLCAANALYQADLVRQSESEHAARHLLRMFRLAQSHRRMLTHCRMIDPKNYAPIHLCTQLLARLYTTKRIVAYDESTFIPLLKPFAQWSAEVLGKELKPYDSPVQAVETLFEVEASLFLGLDIGLHSRSPTDCARLLSGFINEAIDQQLGKSQTHSQIYKHLINIKRFLTPYLLDVRHFKRKHRLDAFLN